MNEITTYVGIDAHKKDLFVAMLIGDAQAPVTWTVPNEPAEVRRLVRKLERESPRRAWPKLPMLANSKGVRHPGLVENVRG